MALTQSSISQFVRIGKGEPSGSTVSQLKLRLFSLGTKNKKNRENFNLLEFQSQVEIIFKLYPSSASQFAELAKANRQVRQFHISFEIIFLKYLALVNTAQASVQSFNLKLRLFSLSTPSFQDSRIRKFNLVSISS